MYKLCHYIDGGVRYLLVTTYGTGHMQRHTRRQAPASTRLKWVSHHMTLLVRVLTRVCVLLSFVCALAHRVVKNLLEHHKSFTMAILYKGPASINLVDMIRNHSGLLQESWLIPPMISIYQIRIVVRFYGQALKFKGTNE